MVSKKKLMRRLARWASACCPPPWEPWGHGVDTEAQASFRRSPLVICGPSGVGKGTIIKEMMTRFPYTFGFCVSHTTRAPRPGEVDGEHYHFTTREAMQAAISAGQFIEHADVHSNMYGTSFEAVEKVMADGRVCVLDIDAQGVRNVKKTWANSQPPHYVFIMPPARPTPLGALEARLRKRATESERKIQERLDNARAELEYAQENGGANFDLQVVNDDLATAVNELCAAIQSWERMKLTGLSPGGPVQPTRPSVPWGASSVDLSGGPSSSPPWSPTLPASPPWSPQNE